MLPIALKEEEFKFGNASSWGREQLRVLGVDFYMQRRIDLNRVFGVRESDWSPELRARISFTNLVIDLPRRTRRCATTRCGGHERRQLWNRRNGRRLEPDRSEVLGNIPCPLKAYGNTRNEGAR